MACSSRAHVLVSAASLLFFSADSAKLSNCRNGCDASQQCVGNPFLQPVTDDDCSACPEGREYWPCSFETLCYCWDTSIETRVAPTPSSGRQVATLAPCDILTADAFSRFTDGGAAAEREPFTYSGLCDAVTAYNANRTEKAFQMGSEEDQRAEISAFLAHTAADTEGYTLTREALQCAEPVEAGGRTYCKPCRERDYDAAARSCRAPLVAAGVPYTEYCSAELTPPQGCGCGTVPEQAQASNPSLSEGGYIDAADAFFARGALPLAWNRDYYGASVALTGSSDTLCENPDLVATVPAYAWGVALWRWMEQMDNGSTGRTAHVAALGGSFGATVDVLYGDLECPSSKWASERHAELLEERVAKICRAAVALDAQMQLLAMDGCDGLAEKFAACRESGACPYCVVWSKYVASDDTVALTSGPSVINSTDDSSADPAVNNIPQGNDNNNKPDGKDGGTILMRSSSVTARLQIFVAAGMVIGMIVLSSDIIVRIL